jgi:hypothetical protein
MSRPACAPAFVCVSVDCAPRIATFVLRGLFACRVCSPQVINLKTIGALDLPVLKDFTGNPSKFAMLSGTGKGIGFDQERNRYQYRCDRTLLMILPPPPPFSSTASPTCLLVWVPLWRALPHSLTQEGGRAVPVLFWAIMRGKADYVRVLCEEGADTSINIDIPHAPPMGNMKQIDAYDLAASLAAAPWAYGEGKRDLTQAQLEYLEVERALPQRFIRNRLSSGVKIANCSVQ